MIVVELIPTKTGWELRKGEELMFWARDEEDAVANAQAFVEASGHGFSPQDQICRHVRFQHLPNPQDS